MTSEDNVCTECGYEGSEETCPECGGKMVPSGEEELDEHDEEEVGEAEDEDFEETL